MNSAAEAWYGLLKMLIKQVHRSKPAFSDAENRKVYYIEVVPIKWFAYTTPF
jgi:hypothetical protein